MFDEEIEKAVLFYMIFQKEPFSLSEKDFINPTNKKIIKTINKLNSQKEEISMLTIKNKIDEKSNEILKYLANIGNYVSKTTAETAYRILKEYTKKREIFNLSKDIQVKIENIEGCDNYIEKIIADLHKIEFQTEKDEEFVEQVVKTADEIEKNLNKEKNYDLYTGFFDLDALTDGLHQGELTVIGARPGVGKTTFSLQIAEKIASRNKNVIYVSLEMSETQIIQKILAKKTKINSRKIRNGDLTEQEIGKIGMACMDISQLPIKIITKANSIQQIEIEARRMKNKNKLDLLIIDYLQLVRNTGNFNSREQEVADISRTLKLLSLDLEIPIIALCQLNRNASKNEPTLADIRESGAIEQDADNVVFLYQQENNENIVTVDLQKQRAGNTGISKLKFNKFNSTFVNIKR